jgi:N,N'-diacetyllegionaminate synthase
MNFYIYGETAFHHEGDVSFLYKLIDLAKETGLHGVKFQVLINPNELMSSKNSIYHSFSTWVFTKEEWIKVFTYCKTLGLDVIVMPLDAASFDVIKQCNIDYLDLHSVSFNDSIVLNRIKETGLPVILGIGGRTLKEITEKVAFFGEDKVVLMVGFQAFPTELEAAKIGKIKKLKELFPNVKLGYADHTSFETEYSVYSNEYAYLLGATFFEKHITVNEGIKRVDYDSAVGKQKIVSIVDRLSYLSKLMSVEENQLFEFDAAELKYRNREKVYVAKENLSEGTFLDEQNTIAKMIDKPGGFSSSANIVGKKLKQSIMKDELIVQEFLH